VWSADFVQRVAALRFSDAFNPYADRCAVYDGVGAAAVRRTNLQICLDAALDRGVGSVWVARDLGHRGGRRTGLALTDEFHLERHGDMLGCRFERATVGEPVAERTATVIWEMLGKVREPVFLWNIFPLHPHESGDPFSNRRHCRHEAEAGLSLLQELLTRLKPRRILGIGRDAQSELLGLRCNAMAVRHPSYGGEREFRAGVSQCYDL
jgi:hypothetical protein